MKHFILLLLTLFLGNGLRAQDYTLSANLADFANFGTLNVEFSRSVARRWSVVAGVKYNPFEFKSDSGLMQNKQRLVSAGSRFWPWYVYSGWWLSGKFQYQEYNSGGLTSSETTEGDRLGAGVGFGYSKMVSRHLNLDFGVGLWAGYDRYTVYECPKCGRKLLDGGRNFVLPNDIIIALSYIF